MRRKNGFEWPLHPVQVTGWVVFTADCAIFAAVCLPELEELLAQLLVGSLFGASVCVLVGAAAFATACDPVDPRVKAAELGKATHSKEDGDLPFCNSCCAHVQHNSKHCRVCNKCVHGFDHHCIWFNNCVGEHNYWAFASAIGSVAVMTGTMIVVLTYLFFRTVLDEDDVDGGLVAAAVGMLMANVPLFLLDMQLVLFHIFLTSKGWTTYDYVLQKQDDSMSWTQYAMTCCMELLVIRKIRERRGKGKTNKAKAAEISAAAAAAAAAKAAKADDTAAKEVQQGAVVTPVDGASQADRRDSQEGGVVVMGSPPQEAQPDPVPEPSGGSAHEEAGKEMEPTTSVTGPEAIQVEMPADSS
mmetsp:Transcript_66223/g.158398  ORF Transcript_66223/g.158398 Transcript_66223/m.158398 type:complete len:357 (-) Transcript_66223:68-1138(-)